MLVILLVVAWLYNYKVAYEKPQKMCLFGVKGAMQELCNATRYQVKETKRRSKLNSVLMPYKPSE